MIFAEQQFLVILALGLNPKASIANSLLDSVDWPMVLQLGKQQSVLGVLWSGIQRLREACPNVSLPAKMEMLKCYGLVEKIRQRNVCMDEAVVSLCQKMTSENVRIFVFKGQPLATLYPDCTLRQSGDIDFYCPPNDWNRAVAWLKQKWGVVPNELNTEKDVSFICEDVVYEMHRKMTLFMYPRHSRYWEKVVMPEILENLGSARINGFDVPTLSPIHNVLFVFIHIFQHLISDGIGLRQFCDWLMTIRHMPRDKESIDILDRHLNSIGLKRAFSGLGAILTDYLGLSVSDFPFEISEEDHRNAPKLMENMLEMGNFGHNKHYKKSRGAVHGIEHLSRITMQVRLFGHYAPAEAWWRIPYMFKWWIQKIGLMIKGCTYSAMSNK